MACSLPHIRFPAHVFRSPSPAITTIFRFQLQQCRTCVPSSAHAGFGKPSFRGFVQPTVHAPHFLCRKTNIVAKQHAAFRKQEMPEAVRRVDNHVHKHRTFCLILPSDKDSIFGSRPSVAALVISSHKVVCRNSFQIVKIQMSSSHRIQLI